MGLFSSSKKKLKSLSKYLLMLVILVSRNELESLKEKMVKKGEEIQSQLDEREENVCHIVCFTMKIHNILRRIKSKCKACLFCSLQSPT